MDTKLYLCLIEWVESVNDRENDTSSSTNDEDHINKESCIKDEDD